MVTDKEMTEEMNDESVRYDRDGAEWRGIGQSCVGNELSYDWDNFVEMVKYHKRYTFFHDASFSRNEGCHDNVLARIMEICETYLMSSVQEGETLYRSRVNKTGVPRSTFAEMSAPPANIAKENRMSPAGISMFYGTFDKATSVTEVRNHYPDAPIDLAEFRLKRKVEVIDLFEIPDIQSFWVPRHYREYKFLKRFHNEISKPIIHNPGIEYVPTQIFTEYIRYFCRRHVDGLTYRSSLTGRKNIVLFYDDITTCDILTLDNVYIYK